MGIISDEQWMKQALEQARLAQAEGEVPIGAVLVKDEQLIAADYNRPIQESDPSAHAEINLLRKAGKILQNYRLLNTTLYVTLEPCAMCAYAMVHARIKRLVFAAPAPKTGAAGGVINLLNESAWNHRIEVSDGVLAEPCGDFLRAFFKERR